RLKAPFSCKSTECRSSSATFGSLREVSDDEKASLVRSFGTAHRRVRRQKAGRRYKQSRLQRREHRSYRRSKRQAREVRRLRPSGSVVEPRPAGRDQAARGGRRGAAEIGV